MLPSSSSPRLPGSSTLLKLEMSSYGIIETAPYSRGKNEKSNRNDFHYGLCKDCGINPNKTIKKDAGE